MQQMREPLEKAAVRSRFGLRISFSKNQWDR